MRRLLSLSILIVLAGCSASGDAPTSQPTKPVPPNPPLTGPEYYQMHQQLRGRTNQNQNK